MKKYFFGFLFMGVCSLCKAQISGIVKDNSNNPIADARITLFNADTSFFAEARSNNSGNFQFNSITNGIYLIGASHINGGYFQSAITVNGLLTYDINLPPDTAKGRWNVVVNSPEPLGGTNLAILLPDGNIFFCHNTRDPFYFNPVTNMAQAVTGDTKVQGCVGLGMLPDGKIIFFGGADRDVYGPGTKKVKTFNPVNQIWSTTQSLMKDFRWYPTTSQLPSGKWLLAGGGNENNPVRSRTSEIFNPVTNTSILVDTIFKGNEVSPVTMLYNGKILMTHRPPQLFDENTLLWELTGDFVQGNRMPNGDHSDHEIILLPEGNVVAMGYKSFTPGIYGNMVEIYNPLTETWSLGANNTPIRSRTKSVLLPNKKILVLGGEKENPADPTPVNAYNYTSLAHYYDPYSNTWKQLRNMNYAREYHATAIVAPDGRVIVAGGEGAPGNEPSQSIIEAFTPPYLMKGIRPRISNLNKTNFNRNETIRFDISRTNSPTKVILMSLPLVTHFMNSGLNRFVELSFTQTSNNIIANIPANSLQLPDGYYTLTVMTDDIPSLSSIIKISSYIVLPVTLNFFKGVVQGENAVLNWQTATEINNDYFKIERSLNGVLFSSIARINGAGNSVLPISYTYTDTNISKGRHFYRLAQYDNGGRIEYSNTIILDLYGKKSSLTIYPNPVQNVLKLNSSEILNGFAYCIKSINGVTVECGKVNPQGIATNKLPEGIYWIEVYKRNGEKLWTRFIKSK